MFLKKLSPALLALTLAVASAAPAPVPAKAGAAQIVPSTKQGMQKFAVTGGNLIMVAGSYQDVLTYKRSLTFYFTDKTSADWDHVPIYDVEVGNTLTWLSISSGETTTADAVLALHGDAAYLLIAERPAKGQINASWFKLIEADGNTNDGPAHQFVKIATHSHPRTKSIEDVLKAESLLKPSK
ncbi:hypothetical protein [Pseudoduganella violaceinigra]|uniref:hypothetical protein n=1 Tax=Pseudoduganella violaceinigra TaxID=246602 RepID=UPI00040B98F1|nr:hypothetical protein [Pseudoduganella violaceinigra]